MDEAVEPEVNVDRILSSLKDLHLFSVKTFNCLDEAHLVMKGHLL